MEPTRKRPEEDRPQRRPGVSRAYAYLRDVAASLNPGERLPGITALARAAGVAPQTMLRASGLLRTEGILVARPRSGTYRANGADPKANSSRPAPPSREAAIADSVVQSILSGALPVDGTLPGRTALAAARGVSPALVSRALSLLVREGWLERIGRSYRAVLHLPGHHNTLLLIARSATGGDLVLARSQDHVRHLQGESAAVGVGLRLVRYDERRDWVSEARDLIRSRKAGTVLGAVVWPLTVHQRNRVELLHHVSELDVPVAVFDDDDEEWPQGRFAPSVRFFATARGKRAGHDVGRHLLGLGHRSIAFISASHDGDASKARLAGLQQAYAEAGAEPVDACVSGLAVRERRERPLLGALARIVGHVSMEWLADSEVIDASTLQPIVSERVERSVVQALFEKVFARAETTAWVTFNDDLGAWAIDWLHARGVAVPGDMSVVGFDESPRALDYNLTSYDFGGRAALRAAVTYLIRPALARRLRSLYEAPGVVVPRQTTAAIRPRPAPE